jgi:hypothetical protein
VRVRLPGAPGPWGPPPWGTFGGRGRAMRAGRMIRAVRGVGLAALLAGCAGGNGDGGGAPLRLYADFDPASTAPRACATLTLSATSGQPLDTITISGLPVDLGQIAVYLETVADGIGALYPTGPVAGGQANFLVPVGPDADPDGGDVMLTVTNTAEACPAVPFTIDPLPAPAADYATYMADLAATMQEFLDLVARVFGTDYATLSAAAAPPAEGLVPIFVAIKTFDAALKSPPDLDTDQDRELVVRLLTQADALGVLGDAIADLEQWLTDHGSFKVAGPLLLKAGSDAPDGSSTVRMAGEACTLIEPPDLDIPTTERLSAIMNDPTMAGIADGLEGLTTATSGISSVLGVVNASGPTDALGALATAAGTAVDFAVAASPSSFTSLSFDAESPIWEDQTLPQPAWSNAQAHVTSSPFSVSGAVADNLLALAGMSPVGGWTITVLTFSYEDEINDALEDVVGPEGPLCVTVPAQEWGPFDVSSSDWSESIIAPGSTITKTTHETYLPAMLGSSDLDVRVRADKFGNATITARNSVLVNAKTVSISPISPKVDEPGDPVTLTVSVNAHFPETVDFTPPPGVFSVDVSHEYLGGGIHTYTFNTPGFEDLFPAHFRVESTSSEVPPDTFDRADSVNILLNSALEITGARACIAPGETVDLEAVLTGFDDPETRTVTWTESAGTTTPGTPTRLATYQAPGTEGTVTVRAETPAPGMGAENVSDEVEMLVSESCLRQFFAAYLISTADGDPDCDGPQNDRGDIGQEADDIDTLEDIAGLHIPTPEGPYFSGGPIALNTLSSFTESRDSTVGGVDTCTTLLPFARADLTIDSAGPGVAEWEASYQDRGTCIDEDDGPYCNVGRSAYVVGHYLYLPIEERGTYQLTVEMACTLYPHYGGLQVFINRYIDGTDFVLPNGPDSLPTPENPTPDPPFVPPIVTLDYECTGSPISQSVVMDLAGPLGTSGADLIAIFYNAGPAGFIGGLTPEQIQENAEALDPVGKGPNPEFLHSMEVRTNLERLD